MKIADREVRCLILDFVESQVPSDGKGTTEPARTDRT